MRTGPLFMDTTALLRRYVHGPGRGLVLDAMAGDAPWCASALCLAEMHLALRHLAVNPAQQRLLEARLREDWAAFWVVPVDGRALAVAAEIGAEYGLRTVDAIHLACAARLPRPAGFMTFDRHQIPAAAGLGFEVLSPLVGS